MVLQHGAVVASPEASPAASGLTSASTSASPSAHASASRYRSQALSQQQQPSSRPASSLASADARRRLAREAPGSAATGTAASAGAGPSAPRGRIQMRARNAEMRPADPQAGLPVQPWRAVRSHIAALLAAKNLLTPAELSAIAAGTELPAATADNAGPALSSSAAGSTAGATAQGSVAQQAKAKITDSRGNLAAQEAQAQAQAQANMPVLPITIPHGFMPLRTLTNSRPTIQSVLYIQNSSMFVSLDSSHIHLWKGGARIHKIPTQEADERAAFKQRRSGSGISGNSYLPGVVAISKWIYLDKQRVYIVANTRLQLKVLDVHFEELSVISNPKPVLSIEYVPGRSEIICGEVGSIRIWKLVKSNMIHKEVYDLVEKRVITHNLAEEWVSFVYYERLLDRIFAACDTNLYVYDYETCDRIDNFYNIHDLAITCAIFYEPFEYIITGGKDGSIKVWNARKYLMFDFHDHFNAITSLLLMEKGCEASPGSIPVVLSSSLDATIRMWNFETGQCLYRLDTQLPCLGMAFIKRNHFYHYTKASIQQWNINRYQLTFVFFRSTPFIIRRVTHPSKPARILTAVADGSIKMISPVTGIVIGTGFPVHKDTVTRDLAWNMSSDVLYSFNNNGDIVVYGCNANPFKILDIWELSKSSTREQVECVCGLDFYNHVMGISYEADHRIIPKSRRIPKFFLVAGTESGQILNLDLDQRGKAEFLVQAHTARITMLSFDPKAVLLISGGQDMLFKIWTVRSVDTKNSFGGGILSGMLSSSAGSQSITLTALSSITLNGFDAPSKAFAMSYQASTLAVPLNGGIVFANYTKDTVLTHSKAQQEQTGRVCAIAAGHDFGLWASASDDGTVKIWDSDNTLLREIQFGETITSVCFANERGDLLVGVSGQISIVRVQDYITYAMMRQIVARVYKDDEAEIPIAFDPNLDFWEYRYEQELSLQGSVPDWHMQKEQINRTHSKEDDLTYLLQLSQQRRLDAAKRRNREKFLAAEKTGFMHALHLGKIPIKENRLDKVDLVVGSTEKLSGATSEPFLAELIDPATPTNEPVEELPEPEDEPEASEPDELQAMNTASEPEPAGEAATESPAAQEEEKITETEDAAPLPALDASHAQSSLSKQQERIRLRNMLMRSNMALPNSTLIGEIEPARRRSQMATAKVHGGRHHGDGSDSDSEPGAGSQNPFGARGAKSKKPMAARSAIDEARRRRLSARQNNNQMFERLVSLEDDAEADDPPDQPTTFEPVPIVEEPPVVAAAESSKTNSAPTKSKHGSKKPKSHKKPPSSKHKSEKADASKRIDEEAISAPPTEAEAATAGQDQSAPSEEHAAQIEDVMPAPVTSISVSAPADPADELLKARIDSGAVDETDDPGQELGKSKSNTGRLGASMTSSQPHGGRHTTHLEFLPLNPHVVNISPNFDAQTITSHEGGIAVPARNSELRGIGRGGAAAIARVRRTTIDESQANADSDSGMPPTWSFVVQNVKQESDHDLRRAFEKYRQQQSPDIIRSLSQQSIIAAEEAAQFVWDLFRGQNNSDRIAEMLKPLQAHVQEGGEETKPTLEISTVASVLANVIRGGTEEQIIEASRAMLFLFKTFKQDFRTPLHLFILPQIDQLDNESPLVRAVLCENIAKYGLYHEGILLSLIYSLNDKQPIVVESAMRGLAQFGVTDKTMLRAAMIHLGMIQGDLGMSNDSVLEKMRIQNKLAELQRIRDQSGDIMEWLSHVDQHAFRLRRNDSYFEHLAGKFFPPDAGDHDGLMRAKMMNDACVGVLESESNAAESTDFSLLNASNIDGWDVRSERSQRMLRRGRGGMAGAARGPQQRFPTLASRQTMNAIQEHSEVETMSQRSVALTRYTVASRARTDGHATQHSRHVSDSLLRRSMSRTMTTSIVMSVRAMTAGSLPTSQRVSKGSLKGLKAAQVRPNTTSVMYSALLLRTNPLDHRPRTVASVASTARDIFPPL
ncbi:hypothetical protein HK105_203620 [Polyrhizophydium stewartii]|uniref:Uncharacterized protein n=1 Tax=Polyrhizophydium stewartii TaxID=2732419 RepID=A0ABR4NBC7_9FUNG